MNRRASRESLLLGLAGAVVLFALNFFVCQKLYGIEYLRHMHSVEGAFMAISRYAMENWRDLTWFPLWYAGIPYQNTYPPLLHLAAAALAKLVAISPALSFHVVNAFLYCLGPVTLYWMALRLSGLWTYSFLAGLLYSLLSPSALLITDIRTDLGGALYAQRLHTLVFYGDGPFVCALTLVPMAVVLLDFAVRRRSPAAYLAAALAMASVVLTNFIGGAVLAAAVLAYWFGMAGEVRSRPGVTIIAIAVLAYLLASPWIPPSTVRTIQANSETIGGYYPITWRHAVYAALLGSAVLLLHLLFRKLRTPGWLRVAVYFSLIVGAVTMVAEWFGVSLLPQPYRYHLAMEMALCLLAAFLSKSLFDRFPAWGKVSAALLVLALCVSQAVRYRRFASELIRPIDITTTTEYKTARWFDRNMGGKRVMAPGSTSYYMNIFTDTPQLGGGAEQGALNWQNRVALYVLYSGQNAGERDAEISLLWLKAFGVQAVAVGGPESGEHYKPFVNPRKFAGLLPELWREGDDYIYAVPNRSASLARVVRREDLVDRAPLHGLDVDRIGRYVAALDDPNLPLAEMRWTSRHSARIVADLERDHVVSVQVTYHPGWRAEVEGKSRRIYGDKIGLMVIEPQCEGPCAIDLVYDGGIEMKLAKTASLTGLAGCLAWAALRRRRRRRDGV